MDEYGKRTRAGVQHKGVYPTGWLEACGRSGQGDRESFSGCSCNSAAGEQLPHTFIFKGHFRNTENQKAICQELSTPTSQHPNGWGKALWGGEGYFMTRDIFIAWIDWFVDQVKASPDDPVLLALDGHSSRTSLQVWKYCLEKGVFLFIFPGGITSHIQPQDVGVLGPLTRKLNSKYKDHCQKQRGPITTLIFLRMLRDAWEESVNIVVIKTAWDKSGLWTKDGCPNRERLFPAIKAAAPYLKESIAQDPADQELLEKAFMAPLPCPLKHDKRAPAADVDVGELTAFQKRLLELREQLLTPEVYKDKVKFDKALAEAFKNRPEKKKRSAREKADDKHSRQHLHARFINNEVRGLGWAGCGWQGHQN